MISAPGTRTATLHGRRLHLHLNDSVPPYLRSMLSQVEPFPAAIRDGRGQILAFNRSYDALFGLGTLPEACRNTLLLFFTDHRMRRLLPDWELDAPRLVSQFRAAVARHPGDPAWTTLLERLRRDSPGFDRLWRDDDLSFPAYAPMRFLHPVVGQLRLAPYHLWSEPHPDGLVATGYTPADAATAAKLPQLRQLPG